MSASLLSLVLNEKIPISQITQWLQTKEANFPNEFQCSLGEFISYLLNFIHEEALCFEKYRETPKKVHTPKAIRKLELPSKPKRRSALFNESSPKSSKKDEKGHLPISPVSPLYTRLALPVTNTPTPGKSKNLCLGDFISPNRKSSAKKINTVMTTTLTGDQNAAKKLQVRRLNPTNVSIAQRERLNSENSFDFKQFNEEATTTSKKDDELIKHLENKLTLGVPTLNPKLHLIEILPDLNRVLCKQQLDVLSLLYIDLISNNAVLNVTSELYFILTLLLSKQYDNDYFSSRLFTSIHNVVYFAVACLRSITDDNGKNCILTLLDKSTLRLFANNERVKSLDGTLAEKLLALSEGIVEISWKLDESHENNVCFDSETDNRENFPSESSFYAFRKQRDIFYEILHTWETNHTSEGWNFGSGLGGKIKTLIGMHNEPANFRHLSRLFKSQLLITCSKLHDETLHENHLSILTNFPNLNTEKLNRLKSRLVAKDSSNGINSSPTFPGSQEFYKEFILHAQTHIFCAHVKNVFIHDLLQLNDDVSFEAEAGIFDQESRNNYCLTVKSLQLLAKFIGFIDGLPYRTPTIAPLHATNDKLTMEEIESRSWMTPPIDLHVKLTLAITNHQLVLVIPWLSEYLAMLDATTLRLPYYEPLFEKLFAIFIKFSSFKDTMPMWNAQLIRCCLGWLFEQAQFPSELYFHFLNIKQDKVEDKSKLLAENDVKYSLDSLAIIDLQLLHTVCPFLKEFKKLLQYNCNRNGSITSKHITPVTSLEANNSEMNEKRLKLQLQESFLNSKPSSLRKTLEFVSERVASSIVKAICNIVVPDVKLRASNERRKVIVAYVDAHVSHCEIMTDLSSKSLKIMEEHLKIVRSDCEICLSQQTKMKIPQAVLSLLSSDELPESVDVCSQIASRICEDRVRQWINTHVNTSIFKDFDLDFEKVSKLLNKERQFTKQKFNPLPTQGRSNIEHMDSDDETEKPIANKIWNPSKLMTNLQQQCADLLSNSLKTDIKPIRSNILTIDDVLTILQKAEDCHAHRCDLADVTWHQINQQIVDYFILLSTHCPQIVTQIVINKFITFWQTHKEVLLNDIFNGIVSIRNTVILMSATEENSMKCWKCYTSLLHQLLSFKLLTCESFEEQCLSVFRNEWEAVTLDKFCKCLQEVVDGYDKRDKFAFLLQFLANYCVDLEF